MVLEKHQRSTESSSRCRWGVRVFEIENSNRGGKSNGSISAHTDTCKKDHLRSSNADNGTFDPTATVVSFHMV